MVVLRHVEFETGHSDGMLVNVYNNSTGSLLGAFQNPGVISQPIAAVPAYDINVGGITGNWLVDVFISGVRSATVFASETHLITEDSPPWLQSSGSLGIDPTIIRSSVGLTSANLDTQLISISGYIDTEVGAIKTKTDQLTFTLPNKVDVTSLVTSGISPTDIRSAIGLTSANLDGQLLGVSGVRTEVDKVPRLGNTYKHRNTGNSSMATVIIETP